MILLKKCLLFLSFYLFGIAAFSAAVSNPEYIMFIGNPGVGKSAIINSLIGRVVAQSGVSAGHGLTRFFSSYAYDGKEYFDTPGLEDTQLREQAAIEIENALKKDGIYRLFFVITLEALRVRPADVTTINTVMSALKISGKKFNVIVNKVTKQEKNKLKTDPKALAEVYAAINSGEHKTDSIWYIDKDRDLEDGDIDLLSVNAELKDFVFNKSFAITIAKEDVTKVETDKFEQVKAQFEKSLSILRDEIASGNEKYQSLISQMASIQASLNTANEELKIMKKTKEEDDKKVKQIEENLAVARKEAEMEKQRRIKAENETCIIL